MTSIQNAKTDSGLIMTVLSLNVYYEQALYKKLHMN